MCQTWITPEARRSTRGIEPQSLVEEVAAASLPFARSFGEWHSARRKPRKKPITYGVWSGDGRLQACPPGPVLQLVTHRRGA